jgi:hypothetical protein
MMETLVVAGATLAGTLVGGLITFFIQRWEVRSQRQHGWRQLEEMDLREFQDTVFHAITSQEHDIGWCDLLRREEGIDAVRDWVPQESFDAVMKAERLSARVMNKTVKEQWREVHELLLENRRDLMALLGMFRWDPLKNQEDLNKLADEVSLNMYRRMNITQAAHGALSASIEVEFRRLHGDG